MPGGGGAAARYEQRTQTPQPHTLKQLAASVFDHLRKPSTRPTGSRSAAKIAVGGSTHGHRNPKSFKSVRSVKSNRTGGRVDDDELWEYSPPTPEILGDPVTQQAQAVRNDIANGNTNTPKNHSYELAITMQPEIRRQSSIKKKLVAYSAANLEGDDKQVRAEDLYCDYDNPGDDIDPDDEDDDLDDEKQGLEHVLTAEAQDELAYFSQRMGSVDFKLQRRHVIHPHGRTRALWDSVLLLLISWILIVVPLELSFQELDARIRRDLLRFDLFVDGMFTIDIFLNFNTAIERDGKLHFSFRSIYRYYLRGWFFFDAIWTFPFYALYEKNLFNPDLSITPPQVAGHSRVYNFLRVLRLMRVAELPHVRRRLEYSLLISSKISRLGSFLYLVLALSHVFSCMFAYLAFGDQEHLAVAVEAGLLENADLQTKYIASFYWSMMTMTTVGYGDITVRTNTGRIFALAAMVVGGGIFAYGITNVVALFQQLYVEETQHRQKMDWVNTFMHNRALPRKLRDEIRANFFHMRKATRESKLLDYEIFRQMSRTLQSNVATIFCQEMMPHKLPFLAGCNAEFIHELYLSMEVRCYLPGEDIIRQGDYGTEMHFLFVGHVQVFLNHTKVAALGPSAFFGEFGIFTPKKPRLATIQAMDFSETHCIERRDVFRILVEHPFMLRSIKCLAALRSRKALNIMYESGGKSRTLLQGLASMWHQEGILGMLPRGLTSDDLPSVQEYLPTEHPATATSIRRGSVRASLGTNFPGVDGAGSGGRRKSVALPSNHDLAAMASARTARIHAFSARNGSGSALESSGGTTNAAASSPFLLRPKTPGLITRDARTPTTTDGGSDRGSQARSTRRRRSIDVTDKALLVTDLASIGTHLPSRDNLADGRQQEGQLQPGANSPPHADPRLDILIAQLQDLVKRQELLDDQMQEILHVLESDHYELDRFREQHQRSASVPPLVRDRSQYFHRSNVGIPEGKE